MSLEIHLEHGQHHTYYPGQTIRGYVNYTISKQRRIKTASLSFRGKITTTHAESRRGPSGNTHGPRMRTEEILRLFDFSEQLFQGPYDVPPQKFNWPFEFDIPTHVEIRRANSRGSGFVHGGRDRLPPSFDFDAATYNYHASARIKYKLAVFVDNGGFFRNDELELPITIRRAAMVRPPSIVQNRLREFLPPPCWTNRSFRPESHTLRQKFKHVFTNDPELRTPCIAFQAFVSLPVAMTAEQGFPVDFSIKHIRITKDDPESPALTLDSIRLSLWSHTQLITARAGSPLPGDRYAEGGEFVADQVLYFEPVKLPLDATPVKVAQDIKLMDWRGAGSVHLLSSFLIVTVRHVHRLRVEAIVRHEETSHQFQMKVEVPCRILDPSARDLGLDELLYRSVEAEFDGLEAVDMELPRYEDDVRPPATFSVADTT
ncbi:hypothetical protein LTR64_005035 [Lithohypha guttulata]|uniref:uncharacterized protein n=1 Tax=Lithohypha guttulata TaxID=1690604 RepID=UPI00315D99AF